jgi:hypothetical protein
MRNLTRTIVLIAMLAVLATAPAAVATTTNTSRAEASAAQCASATVQGLRQSRTKLVRGLAMLRRGGVSTRERVGYNLIVHFIREVDRQITACRARTTG